MARIRPVRRVVRASPAVQKLLWRLFYEVANLGHRDLGRTLLNYGYAPLDASVAETRSWEPTENHFGLQLYEAVAGAAELSGLDVLGVGCGRGGGTVFVFERFAPRTMIGLDLAHRTVRRCSERYARPGLEFVTGDAERLPFPDSSLDVVLSVESSHCYANPAAFLREAHRVLRHGGRLLFADLRHSTLPPAAPEVLFCPDDVATLRLQLADAGFNTLEEADITANVVRALQLDTPSRLARIERWVPRSMRRIALAFAAVEGTPSMPPWPTAR